MSASPHAGPRFAHCLLRPLLTGVVAAVLSLTAAVADDDDEIDDEAPVPELAPGELGLVGPVSVSNVYAFVFDRGYDARLARGQLDILLQQKISGLDGVCVLTDDQKRKLQLAGRGDIKRLIDRVEDIGTRLRLAGQDEAQRFVPELTAVKRCVKSGFLDDPSLFDKVVKRSLTIEQNARIAALREIEREGGRVYADSAGANAILDISLTGISLADEDLKRLKLLTGLRGLDLASTPVTDAGLVHLEGLTNLRLLDLSGTKVTDAGLAGLKRLSALQRLDLFGTQVTSAGLAHLAAITDLRELNLSETRVDDLGLAHVKGLRKLQSLNLHQTQTTDAGLAYLRAMTDLEWLDVSGTRVSDAGLSHLTGLRNLQWVNLSSTQVTDAGLSDLKRALPATRVWKRAVPAQD